ncbi:MAG: PIN domain-containing protein [Gammaproteobacteria bacterium]|nr:PIN domain-containing protein [Gammaproteobacteria bacterium]
MYLIDTSVWIDFLKQRKTRAVAFLEDLLGNPLACGITDQVYLELLQGARDEESFNTLERYFSGQRFYNFENSRRSHAAAARIYFECRRAGIAVRSSIDCLIAQSACEHGLTLLHHDGDYAKMARVLPELKQKHFLPG